jgi:hypothetical protein
MIALVKADILASYCNVVVYYTVYKHNINHKMIKFQLIIWRHVSAI